MPSVIRTQYACMVSYGPQYTDEEGDMPGVLFKVAAVELWTKMYIDQSAPFTLFLI